MGLGDTLEVERALGIERKAPEVCNALAPICGDRCTREKGHEKGGGPLPHHHQLWKGGRLVCGWVGDFSSDPSALESEARCKGETRITRADKGGATVLDAADAAKRHG